MWNDLFKKEISLFPRRRWHWCKNVEFEWVDDYVIVSAFLGFRFSFSRWYWTNRALREKQQLSTMSPSKTMHHFVFTFVCINERTWVCVFVCVCNSWILLAILMVYVFILGYHALLPLPERIDVKNNSGCLFFQHLILLHECTNNNIWNLHEW